MINNFLCLLVLIFYANFKAYANEEHNNPEGNYAALGLYTPYQAVVIKGRGQPLEMMMCPLCNNSYTTKALLGDIAVDVSRAHGERCANLPSKLHQNDSPNFYTPSTEFMDYHHDLLNREFKNSQLEKALYREITLENSFISLNSERFSQPFKEDLLVTPTFLLKEEDIQHPVTTFQCQLAPLHFQPLNLTQLFIKNNELSSD